MKETTSETTPAPSPASDVTDQGAPAAPVSHPATVADLQAEADALIEKRANRAAHVLNWLRVLVVLVYPLALLGGMVWLFASFGPGWGLVAVLFLGVLMLFNRPAAPPSA